MPFLAHQHLPIPNKDLLSWMFDEPVYDLEKPIYIDALAPSRSISSNQARILIRQLVAGFRASGLKKGDCVCVHSFNDLYYPILFLGIIAAGGVFTGTNPSHTSFELVHHWKTARAKFVVAEPELLVSVGAAAKECNIPQDRIFIFNVLGQAVPQGFQAWSELLSRGEEDWVRFNDQKASERTAAALLFSSGTTGLPKAAIITHRNLIAVHVESVEPDPSPHEKILLAYLPMFHAGCVPRAHTTPLRAGQRSIVMRRFDVEVFLSTIQQFRITDVTLMPPIVHMVLASPKAKKYDLSSLKEVTCGGAPLSKEHQRQFELLMGGDGVLNQSFGMTETIGRTAKFWYPENDQTGSVGRFIANLDIKIVDENGKDITAPGATGELLVRGPSVIPAYFDNPAANAASFDSEGYFRTGDIFTCEEGPGITMRNARFWVTDRKKDLIKVRGFQVSPAELEAVLLQHPAVADATVIGVTLAQNAQNSRDGEHPRAYVVRRSMPGGTANVTEADIKAWNGQRLAKYKALSGGVVFVDAIPRNAGGKVLRRILIEGAATPMAKL